jgi:phage terminase large subunit-like protein
LAQGIPCCEVKPTVQNFSHVMKQLEADVGGGKLAHQKDPAATWMVSNVVAKEDFKENVFPRKEKPEKKIDFFVALLMAKNLEMRAPAQQGSVYDQRGVLVL